MTAGERDPLAGPAEEARRLVEALGNWASTRIESADDHIATGSEPCQVCPVCQLISALRGDNTDVVARLGEAWSAFLAVLSGHSHPSPSQTEDQAERDVEPLARPVQNIDVR